MIFIDADAYIALYVEKDANHKKAILKLDKLKKMNEKAMTSFDVISEVSTKLSYFMTKGLALSFINDIINSDIVIDYVSKDKISGVMKLFEKQKSKRVSITDCVNMYLASERKVECFFSFDKHYKQNGFKLI
jgi:predicted nucleic acid-binding protein